MLEQLIQAVQDYLEDQKWHYNFDNGKSLFSFNMNAQNLSSVRVTILVHEDGFECYGTAPMKVPDNKLMEACEFVARANYGMRVGTLELDVRDGEIRCRTYIIGKEALPAMADVEKCVDYSFMLLDHYGKGLLALLFGGLTAEKAVKLVEGD